MDISKTPLLSKILLVVFVVVMVITPVLIFQDPLMFPEGYAFGMYKTRFAITALFILVGLIVLKLDPEKVDKKLFDLWTLPHFLWGVMFGIWYLPLAWLLVIIVLWEVFEKLVDGFGEDESFVNRVVDVAAAIVGWITVVVTVMVFMWAYDEKIYFPLIAPSKFIWN